ncbi:hypothetical protein ACJJTC_003924 [Scirpophaga incertulas]
MYFEIENTPEHIRRSRRVLNVPKQSPKEDCPRLVLAPFSRPAQVVFENVAIGSSSERTIEVFNPSKKLQQITLNQPLPAGLIVDMPEESLLLEPETCYCLTLIWTPRQPTALRDTIQFLSENRRYDVILILKTGLPLKGQATQINKVNQYKGFKISPGKMKKKAHKKSPVAIYKKKAELIYNNTKIKKTVNILKSSEHRILQPSNSNNIIAFDTTLDTQYNNCPFDSLTSVDLNFDTSEIFSNLRQMKSDKFSERCYNESFVNEPFTVSDSKPSEQLYISGSELFDNLKFTPLKDNVTRHEQLNKGPKVITCINQSERDSEDNFNMKSSNKENETHSIIGIAPAQPLHSWFSNNYTHKANVETPVMQNSKIPNTSSPTEFNNPNFSINTELSRISDQSFFPQRYSTDKKGSLKFYNETRDLTDDDANHKFGSDTFTKESPKHLVNFQYTGEQKPPHFFMREQPRMCRQALFKENQVRDLHYSNSLFNLESYNPSDIKFDVKSPTPPPPPLQSIPEESSQFSKTRLLDKTDKQMATFTIDRTIDTDDQERLSISYNKRLTWSKKAFRAEPELWKVPVLMSNKPQKPKARKSNISSNSKLTNKTFEANESIKKNSSLVYHIGNVYSQSSTLDPFLSTTYFYDEEAVVKFETEFKRWLNCILTPPSDLDSSVEQKIDVGKVWLENRNREVPLAPTKEQVCSVYHNSRRLESLRKAARTLFKSPEITLVFIKLNAQIQRKLIAIRSDRNLHLDIGLQKVIMEILLSYNPLWLRIGLEAIYGTILPLKSNSDVEGLTTFIIQRMFRNPLLKNKNSNNIPNMLLPAYMDAIKKFTLKKFFMLVYFLDQAKQRKLISHDPCLFCRNAICKDSREVILRFTRELIAGIGDITKHLRPLGYNVSHKQSYLDEYKYAVHNIASDLRDGVRLTKVMEIILMKNGLLHKLRTPAISRLQKIHNVQVALSALKEANFTIVGDISANDIADGHREKTLSLLWQLIHVFRAPLFEKAANIIQLWWKKKYQVIAEKRKEEQKLLENLHHNATIVQRWWRLIQHRRLVDWQKRQLTNATIVMQKYWRMWLYKRRYHRMKNSVIKVEQWYKSMKLIKEAKSILRRLQKEREELRAKSATIIQSCIRRWLCRIRYNIMLKKIVLVQNFIRTYLIRRKFLLLRRYTIIIQRRYRGKILMKAEVKNLEEKKRAVIIIQKSFRMVREFKSYYKIRKAAVTIQTWYKATVETRLQRHKYIKLKACCIIVQKRYQAILRMRMDRNAYLKLRNATITIQRRYRANCLMSQERTIYLTIRKACITIQRWYRAQNLKQIQFAEYKRIKSAAITIQRFYRNVKESRCKRNKFLYLKEIVINIQRKYRAKKLAHELRRIKAVTKIQEWYKSIKLRNVHRCNFVQLKACVITIQAMFRMIKTRSEYRKLRCSAITIQRAYRKFSYNVRINKFATKIQLWYKSIKQRNLHRREFLKMRTCTITIQSMFRMYKARSEYLKLRHATVILQRVYRQFVHRRHLERSATVIQIWYRSIILRNIHQRKFQKIRTSTLMIQSTFRMYKIRLNYHRLRHAAITIQRAYRKFARERHVNKAAATIQIWYKSIKLRDNCRRQYLIVKSSTVRIQSIVRMFKARSDYNRLRRAVVVIQKAFRKYRRYKAAEKIQIWYKSIKLRDNCRRRYLTVKSSTVRIQSVVRMFKARSDYNRLRCAVVVIQKAFRKYRRYKAAEKIQIWYKSIKIRDNCRRRYLIVKSSTVRIQSAVRMFKARSDYNRLRCAVVVIQKAFRKYRRYKAAAKIQIWYKAVLLRDIYRSIYLKKKMCAITIQSAYRKFKGRSEYLKMKQAAITIQRAYRLRKWQREQYIKITSIIKLQACIRRYLARSKFLRIKRAALIIQAVYRFKQKRQLTTTRREAAAVCIQKNVRRYLCQLHYTQFRNCVIKIQKLWKGKLLTRFLQFELSYRKKMIIKLQATARGYLVRKQALLKKQSLIQIKKEQRWHWAASKIQALYRGHQVRKSISNNIRVTELRRRWRDGALLSTQSTLNERNKEVMHVLYNESDIETVIRAFRSLELLTEVFPMMYNSNAASIVRRVCIYMQVTNRSISSIELLKSAASVLVNLSRYRITGQKIYARERIPPILKFMLRFSTTETHLFCILCTYIWLFSKYNNIKQDLKEFLHLPENHKLLCVIKEHVDRMKRMAINASRNKSLTPRVDKFISHTSNQSLNLTNVNRSIVYPSLEPDYGIVTAEKPRYFKDPHEAIRCLFRTYDL